jgi:hypothetical protein
MPNQMNKLDRVPCITKNEFDFEFHGMPKAFIVPDRLKSLPKPDFRNNKYEPKWNSIALFFNLEPDDQPGDYSQTSVQDAKEWLDEGNNPASPTISEFMAQYWGTISDGKLSFGLNTPRDNNGDPIIPTVSKSDVGSGDMWALINLCLDANPEAIWKAAGSLKKDGKRWIPSVVLVHKYGKNEYANYGGYDRKIDGEMYRIGDRTHQTYKFPDWKKEGKHGKEKIGYMVVKNPSQIGKTIAESVNQNWKPVSFPINYSNAPVVIAAMQTFNGSDPAGIRIRNLSDSGMDTMVEEEKSKEPEIGHNPEDIGYFTIKDGEIQDSAGNRIGEAGTKTIGQAGNQWHSVNLQGSYTNPVVFMQLMSYNGADPCHTRIQNVRSNSFEFQIEEWDYLNQDHNSETVGYVVLEAGRYTLPDGRELEISILETDHQWKQKIFSSSFADSENLLVISHCQTSNDTKGVVTRQNVSGSGFNVRLQVEEANYTPMTIRDFWGNPLVHEYGHNFLEFGDLYGPVGSTLYWDLLGDASGARRMSEVSSVHKERVGWMQFKETIEGPSLSKRSLSLKPFTTSGEAYKIVPDPKNNPHEYFVLEYRKSTGDEYWRPDGGLLDEGLLIIHYNDRLGIPGNWLLRDAPYFDPEYVGASDKGTASRKGGWASSDVFYPKPNNDAFTPIAMPNSNFYGERPSGVRIENIKIDNGKVKFDLSIWGAPVRRLWHTSPQESYIRIEEEKSSGRETKHVHEGVGFIATGEGSIFDESETAIGEAGIVVADQSKGSDWRTIQLEGNYTNPIVLAQVMSYKGKDPCHIRIKEVDSNSFQFQIEEWDYLDQGHTAEEIGYMVLEKGTHQLKNSNKVTVGTVKTDENWKHVSFDHIGNTPVVISRCQTYNGHQAIVTRHKKLDSNSFKIRLQEEEGNNGKHVTETIGFVVINQNTKPALAAGNLSVDENWSLLKPNSSFEGRPITIASIQTFKGGDTAGLRLRKANTKDRAVAGRFTSADKNLPEEIFIRNDNQAALLQTGDSQWFAIHRHDDRIGEWNLRKQDREIVGDLDGDGKDEIYIRSNDWAGVIEWSGNRFYTRTIVHDRIGEWNLRKQDREYIGDFDGDGKDEVYIRSNDWAGMIELKGDDLNLLSIQHDRIGEWDLRAQDREYVGRFSQKERVEIMVRSNNWIGLLQWDKSAEKMKCQYLTSGSVENWNLGEDDECVIGDFDGDGLDEIYIRSDNWAGVLKWKNGKFVSLWVQKGSIQNIGDGKSIELKADDRSYGGHFQPDPVWSSKSTIQPRPGRDGVLHISGTGKESRMTLLTWEDNEMKVRFHTKGGKIEWTPAANGIVIGDFHPRGRDAAIPKKDFQGDRGDDIFVHNAWGTGMIGINHVEFNPIDKPGDIKNQMSITWKQKSYLLSRTPLIDCLPIEIDALGIEERDGGYTLTGDNHLILHDEKRSVIERAKEIIEHYGMNQYCFIGRPHSSMQYFLVDGNAPEGALSGENSISFDPDNLHVQYDKGWTVKSGEQIIVSCPNRGEADRAFAVIKKHGFRYKCWVDSPDGTMTYFRV